MIDTMTQPIFETTRLTLRPMQTADVGLMSLYSSDKRVSCMTTRIPHPNPPGAVEMFIEKTMRGETGETVWAIDATKCTGTSVVGVIGLTDDGHLGYWLGPFFWGLGIATEAARAVVEYADSRGQWLYSDVFQDNPRSRRVLEKVGFQTVGTSQGFSVARGESVQTWQMERSGAG